MEMEEIIRKSIESEGREEFYEMLLRSEESDSGICYTNIYLTEEERDKLRRLYKKYGTLYFCNHLEEEFSSEEIEILLNGENPKDVEGIFFDEPCYLILHNFDESEPVGMGYFTYEEYYFAYDVIRLSKEDYIKLLGLLIAKGLTIKDLKFKDLEKINEEFFTALKKQKNVIALPEVNPFENPSFISWDQVIQRAAQISEKI